MSTVTAARANGKVDASVSAEAASEPVIPISHQPPPSFPLPVNSGTEEYVEVADMGASVSRLSVLESRDSKGIKVPKSYKEAMASPQKSNGVKL
jgi:hypothetical protein